MKFDFANILFAGPCNRHCWFCIGKQLPAAVNVNNLNLFPPRNLEGFIEAVQRSGVRQIVFTGTVTDPQLYRHEVALLNLLRERIANATYSLHTNGALALKRMEVFNHYDKACISFPSFQPATYQKMMGPHGVPELARIIQASQIPIKVSCLLSAENLSEIDEFLRQCQAIGVKRLVLRKLYGETREWPILRGTPLGNYRENPVFDLDGMEVTCWNFEHSTSTSLNLFADGTLGSSYLLTRTPGLVGGKV